MVKLGTVTPKIWENLQAQGVTQESMDEAAAEAVELARLKAAEIAKEALNKASDVDWKSIADAAKEARELDEKYGIWKDVVTAPWFKWLMSKWDSLTSIQLLGEPRMAPAAIVILLYMLYRAKQPTYVLVLFAAFFYNVHALLIVGGSILLYSWSQRRKPKGYLPIKYDPDNEGLPLSEEINRVRDMPIDVDHIVVGSDIGGLFTAALLSRVGHKVLVLEPNDSVGTCSVDFKGVEFDYGNHTTGMIHVYQELLRSAMVVDAPEVRWVRIGTDADGYSFDVVTVGKLGEVVYRAGKAALIDDQITSGAADNREKIATFVTKMENVAKEQSAFFIGRLFKPSTAKWLQSFMGQTYMSAGTRTAQQVLSVNLQDYERLDLLRGLFHTENLPHTELSFGAYVSAMNHAFEGMNYPVGGYKAFVKALVPSIHATGGRVLTKVHIKNVLLDKDNKVASGVVLENGQEIRCKRSVISSLGVIPTYTQLMPKVQMPLGLEILQEAKPRLYTLLLLKGTPEELDLAASDYYQLPSEEEGGEWMHISFPSAKDPSWTDKYLKHSTCVIETEADDDILDAAYRRPDGDTSTSAVSRSHRSTQSSPAVSMGVDGRGMKYYKIKQPSDAKVRRLQQSLVRRLLELYPQLEGNIEEQGCTTLGPFRIGLSHRPHRFAAPGLRPITPIKKFYLSGSDMVLGNFVGGLLGGWLASHAVLGYGALDLLMLQRNINGDLKNVKESSSGSCPEKKKT